MVAIYKRKAPKQATIMSANSGLTGARGPGVNLSAASEEALAEKVAAASRGAWIRENADAIQRYNDLVEQHGLFSDRQRGF